MFSNLLMPDEKLVTYQYIRPAQTITMGLFRGVIEDYTEFSIPSKMLSIRISDKGMVSIVPHAQGYHPNTSELTKIFNEKYIKEYMKKSSSNKPVDRDQFFTDKELQTGLTKVFLSDQTVNKVLALLDGNKEHKITATTEIAVLEEEIARLEERITVLRNQVQQKTLQAEIKREDLLKIDPIFQAKLTEDPNEIPAPIFSSRLSSVP